MYPVLAEALPPAVDVRQHFRAGSPPRASLKSFLFTEDQGGGQVLVSYLGEQRNYHFCTQLIDCMRISSP